VFNLIVYTQPFFFGLLYHWGKEIKDVYFYGAGVAALYLIWLFGPVGHNTMDILACYVFLLCFTYYYYTQHGLTRFKPVSLAFLIVFLNSYWWEFPIHVVGTLTGSSLSLFLLQSLHLVPLLFLREYSEIRISSRKSVVDAMVITWVPVCGVMFLVLYFNLWFGWLLNWGLRFWALLNLLKVFRPSQIFSKDEVEKK
jgi:hypothetical protein